MTPNSLYPGFVKLHQEAPLSEHVYTLPVKPFIGVGGVYYLEEGGNPVGRLWTASLADLIAAIKPFFHSTVTFTFAELWTIDTPASLPQYRETVQLAVAGTNGTTPVPASQTTISYRTSAGGNGKLVMLDTSVTVNQKFRPPFTGIYATAVTYLLGSSSCLFGRDGGRPISVPKILTKTNDVLRRKYNLA